MKSYKLLIVEDEKEILNFISQGLSEESYNVISEEDGKSGFRAYLDHKPDLIILDWMLPGITGVELCKKIRDIDQITPIIFLTARDTLQDTIRGLKAGANDYIKKPFHFEELLERIKIQFRNNEENQLISYKNLDLNIATRELKLNQNTVELTQKEFDLLTHLLKNRGRVCKRKQIIKAVWNIDFEYNTGVLDVFINSLRKKIPFDNKDEFISTIRGVGYIIR